MKYARGPDPALAASAVPVSQRVTRIADLANHIFYVKQNEEWRFGFVVWHSKEQDKCRLIYPGLEIQSDNDREWFTQSFPVETHWTGWTIMEKDHAQAPETQIT